MTEYTTCPIVKNGSKEYFLITRRAMPKTPNMRRPSERIIGRNETIASEVIYFVLQNKYIPTIRNSANRYSVRPEKIILKYRGEEKIIRYTSNEFLILRSFAVRTVKNAAKEAHKQLNTMIPLNPNWEKAEVNKTNTGLAQ